MKKTTKIDTRKLSLMKKILYIYMTKKLKKKRNKLKKSQKKKKN